MNADHPQPPPGTPLRCAVLTPAGRGAIATIAVQGSDALRVVAGRFRSRGGKALTAFPVGSAVFGSLRTAAATAEELVVGLAAADDVEIHCHGGQAAVRAIRDALAADGCVCVEASEWLAGRESDPLVAQAWLALSQARTQRTAGILLDQCRGTLRGELSRIEQLLRSGQSAAAAGLCQSLLARAPAGTHLTQPWNVVIAGLPNAGKSSLLNALVGYERAIVFPEPGTTRDVLTAATAIDGWPIDLIDTAGLRGTGDSIEAEGVSRAWQQIVAADAVLLVADAAAPWSQTQCSLVRRLVATDGATPPNDRRLLIVHNKIDLVDESLADRPAGVRVSARTGEGLDALCRALSSQLVPDPPPPGSAVPFQAEQIAALKRAAAELDRNRGAKAMDALGALRGDHRSSPV